MSGRPTPGFSKKESLGQSSVVSRQSSVVSHWPSALGPLRNRGDLKRSNAAGGSLAACQPAPPRRQPTNSEPQHNLELRLLLQNLASATLQILHPGVEGVCTRKSEKIHHEPFLPRTCDRI